MATAESKKAAATTPEQNTGSDAHFLAYSAYELRTIREFFHPPSPNNLCHLLIPRTTSEPRYLEKMHAAAEALNAADGELLQFTHTCFKQHPGCANLHELTLLMKWQQFRRTSNFPASIPTIRDLFQRVQANGGLTIAHEAAEQRPDLIESFCNLPQQLTHVHRFNIFLPPSQIPRLLEAFVDRIRACPTWTRALDRVEISRVRENDNTTPSYPTLIVYLAPRSTTCNQTALFEQQRWWAHQLDALNLSSSADGEYAEVWHPNATATEGFRLYKQYLQILGCLDRVYDPATNYAFAHQA